jgi:hypothetical protein
MRQNIAFIHLRQSVLAHFLIEAVLIDTKITLFDKVKLCLGLLSCLARPLLIYGLYKITNKLYGFPQNYYNLILE